MDNKDKEGILKKIKDWIKGHKAVVASVAAGIIILIAVIICVSNRKKAADDKEKEGELYYSFSDVQKDIGYLAENDDQLERLNRLVDPMKKSNHIDRDYIDSVSDILGIDKKGYKDILKGYSDKNKIPRQVFDRFYNTVVKDEHISGISTVDIFVKSADYDSSYMDIATTGDAAQSEICVIKAINDGAETYETDNIRLPKKYIGKIIKAYKKNDMIYRFIGLSDKSHTITNVLITGSNSDEIEFLMENEIIKMKLSQPVTTNKYVVDITFNNDGVTDIKPSGEELSGRITSIFEKRLKLNEKGTYEFDEDFKVYDISGTEPHLADSSQYLVGYKDLKLYVDDKKVKAVVITNSELDSKEIGVLINNTDYSSFKMDEISFTCDADYEYSIGTSKDARVVEMKAGEIATFVPNTFNMHQSVVLRTKDPNSRLTITSIERNNIHPSYRGRFEVVMMGSFLYAINRLSVEEYLYGVVSSEIPDNYGEEAFKAFAVVARGYACKMMEEKKYASYDADIDDSNSNLLYNYYPESEKSIAVVNETYGMVPSNNGQIIMPYHFLTSAGVTCSNSDIYNEAPLPYYSANYETIDRQKPLLSSEAAFRNFIDNGCKYDVFEIDEPFYRWSVHYTKSEMDEAVSAVLEERINNTIDSIYIKNENGEFVLAEKNLKSEDAGAEDDGKTDGKTDSKTDDKTDSKTDSKTDDKTDSKTDSKTDDKTDSKTDSKTDDKTDAKTDDKTGETEDDKKDSKGYSLGKITNIDITRRSDAGVVLEIVITGTENTFKITGQTNIRYIFNPVDRVIVKNDGSEVSGYTLLPSPIYYVEETEDGYTIKGGGFGSCLGLSLSGTRILDEMGYNYKDIIHHYYNNVLIRNMFGLYDTDAVKEE